MDEEASEDDTGKKSKLWKKTLYNIAGNFQSLVEDGLEQVLDHWNKRRGEPIEFLDGEMVIND